MQRRRRSKSHTVPATPKDSREIDERDLLRMKIDDLERQIDAVKDRLVSLENGNIAGTHPAEGQEDGPAAASGVHVRSDDRSRTVRNERPEGNTTFGTRKYRLVAVVDTGKCTRCGVCENVCPEHAIRVRAMTSIDTSMCTGCGRCVSACPQTALRLRER